MPYIDSGLVTYIWYPLEDCIVNYPTKDKQIGDRFTDSQAAATTVALRRYQHLTTYMAHFDVDEYVVPPTGITDFRDVVRQYEQFDSLTLQLTWFSSCKGEKVGTSSTLLPFDSYHCFNTDVTPWKSIMKTSRILAFFVHVPVANVQGMVAGNSKHLDNILVAHYRSRRARDSNVAVFSNQSNAMEMYSQRIYERVDAPFKKLKTNTRMNWLFSSFYE